MAFVVSFVGSLFFVCFMTSYLRGCVYFDKWNGTLVTTMFGRKSSAPLIKSDV
jgi:hypothetical protein